MLNHIDRFPENPTETIRERNEFNQYIHPSCRIVKSRVGEYVDLFANTMLMESTIDDYSYTAGNVHVVYSDIGKFCSIANSTVINPGNHPMWRVTQHHCTYRRIQYGFDTTDDQEFFNWRRQHKCILGHDIWIGHGAVILPGVNIGTGAVIGAGSVVTKDIPPYAVAVGVPAKVIKKRFDEATIDKLLASEWWNWPREKLEESFNDLLDIKTFLEKNS